MASFLVVFGTGEGRTASVVKRIESVLAGRDHNVRTVDVERLPDDLTPETFTSDFASFVEGRLGAETPPSVEAPNE